MTTPRESCEGQRVLVTGATGFIGSRLGRRLAAGGARVIGVGRKAPAEETPGVEWRLGDLADDRFVDRLFAEVSPERVFHLASHVVGARDLEQVAPTFRDILAATVNVLTAAARHGKPRVVLTGSLEEPEPGRGPAAPSSPYAAAKAACTGYAAMFHALYGVPVVNARVFMVYGPGQRDLLKLVPYVILSLLRGETPKLSAGDRRVDWIYVDDVVEGLLALGEGPGLEGGRFDLGTGALTPVREVVMTLVRLVRPGLQPEFGALAARAMEQVRTADAAATERATGWRPRTSLEEGLRETVRWYARTETRRQSVVNGTALGLSLNLPSRP